MRTAALLGALTVTAFAVRARAEDAPVSPATAAPATVIPSPPPSPAPSSLPPAADDSSLLHSELARQAAAIDELRASLADERRARENPVVTFSGFIQIDWVVHNQISQNEINGSTGQPLNQDRFTLRRGHLRVDAHKGLVSGVLEIDANTTSGPQVRPIDAEVSVRWPEKPEKTLPAVMLTAGLMRIPFGYEVQEVDYVRPFLERATVMQALFPGEFDLGLRLKAQYRFLDIALAAMNGNPIGNKVFPDLDPIQTKDLVGRIGVDFELYPGVRFQAGTSADTGTGFHPGTPATKDVLVWQDQNGDGLVEPNEIITVGGSPATPSKEFHRFAIAGDVRLIVGVPILGPLTFRGEVVSALNLDRGLEVADPVGAGRDLREVGWSVGATQEVTRWGMIGARYDRYNPDADASQQRALNLVPIDRSYGTLALMGMLRYEGARLLVEYDINTNPLGVSPSGAPTTLADNAFTLRGQMVF